MKKILTLFILLNSINSFAQIDYGWFGLQAKDTCNFENKCERLIIDTINTNNDWQIGSTTKTFFGQASTLPNAIMTDTMNSYSGNNWSYFDLGFSAWDGSGFPYNMYIQFDHKYESDTLIDGGFITLSHDSGQTWVNVLNDSCLACNGWYGPVNSDNLYGYNDSLMNGNLGFSGTSDWTTTTLQWIWTIPAKIDPTDSLIVRFNFISDGNQTNKDGWIIDNIVIGDVYLGSSVEEFSNAIQVKLFPNITNNYFNYKIEDNEKLTSLSIINMEGKIVLHRNHPKKYDRIDILNIPSGNYFVKFIGEGKQAVKRLVIN